jgi:hypothetical protein
MGKVPRFGLFDSVIQPLYCAVSKGWAPGPEISCHDVAWETTQSTSFEKEISSCMPRQHAKSSLL